MSALIALAMPVAHGDPLEKETIFEAVWAQDQRRASVLGQGGAVPHATISFMEFTRAGFPMMILTVLISTVYLYFRYF